MGGSHTPESHVPGSSSMTFAWRWERRHTLKLTKIGAVAVAMMLLTGFMYLGTSVKQVTLVVNGQETALQTRSANVLKLLAERGISVNENDRLSKGQFAALRNGDRIVIENTVPVKLTLTGQTETRYTVGKTVKEALADLNIQVGELDKVTPPLDTPVTSDTALQVVRVEKKVESVQEPIPFQTVTTQDAGLMKGKEQVVQEGQEGVLVKQVESVFEDGKLVATNVLGQNVQTESVKKVVAVGTKNPVVVLTSSSPDVETVTKNGVTFGYKQILKNFTVTAYSAGVASTGKDESHPGYGMTFTGTRVSEGRTIAVDPKVVPLGWWVYIEGIGFRRAEDIGSGVKGKWIDVYYDSEQYANRFGLKRGYTVYIIGPKKPSDN